MRDGDCPKCTNPLFGGISPVAKVTLSGVPALVAHAQAAQKAVAELGNKSDVISFDDPQTGLHTSMFYFCCHTAKELAKMHAAFAAMTWHGFAVTYNTASCNVDTHDNRTVYIHAMPLDQTALFGWASDVERALASAGVPVNHPRKSYFHMTLARVTRQYPADDAVGAIKGLIATMPNRTFGSIWLCSFEFGGVTYHASGCPNGTSPLPVG
jgi:2'-5' RNA ligase